ncbi:hypothetical protein PSHT_01506 [Puccinia striiformis]|uniref:DDE Tnp4 domain-containing protein n=1 Tax=Puccinia striiformis TaxID=27350 RepID=A0A2S4WKC2_9BASI|nr:hypothetical protein PSHT_01506 [Puccinia striiformis]
MPRKSERQKVLQGVEMTLIASLWKLKMADRKSKAMRTNPSHQLTFNFLITAILQMKKLLSNDVLLINLNVSLVNLRLRNSAISLHNDMVKEGLVKFARTPLPRVATISRTYEVLTNTTEEVFRIYARMTRKSFYSLADALKDHHIFYNNSNNPQAPVEMQLLVALSHLGMYGNGGSPHVLAQYYNISPGSVENYTNRCILAIIETLEKKHVYWPNAQQRATFTATLAGRTVFDRCIGFVDGAIFPLTSAPTKHKEDYWMRKMVYAVNSLIVCNWQRRVIYAVHGWCGSAHDQRVYKNSQTPSFRPSSGHLAGPYLPTSNNSTTNSSLTIELLGKKTAKRLNAWLRACVVLHNYLLDLCKAEWDELNNPVENFDPDEDEEIDSGVISGEDVARRDLLFSRFCQLL